MRNSGYNDEGIAQFLAYRYLTIMVLAYPTGLFIRTKKLLPFFKLSAYAFPIVSICLVLTVGTGNDGLLQLLFILWGAAFFFLRLIAVPYILRNCDPDLHSEALALNFSSWSVSMILAGALNYTLNTINPEFFNEQIMLIGFACIGLISALFIRRVTVDKSENKKNIQRTGEWAKIITALSPTMVIAVGAGLTVQFMNLFFNSVFGMDFRIFSLMGAGTYVLVSIAALIGPKIKEHFGYEGAITVTQSLSVLALIGLATTEYFSAYSWAMILAICFYAIRQPLMNMANPMSTELAMYYVGDQNREMTVALTQAIWSGSWFFSSIIFAKLRSADVEYHTIFYITAGFYVIGIVMYHRLIKLYRKQTA